MKRIFNSIFDLNVTMVILFLTGGISGCKKSAEVIQLPADTSYASRIKFILQYDPALYQNYYNDLVTLKLADSLAGKGPFTVFAYSQTANGGPMYTATSIIKGYYPLKNIPPGQTEIINAPNGMKYIVTANVYNGQIQYTVNGGVVVLADQPASNGLINLLSNAYSVPYYTTCLKAIQSNQSNVEFAYALQRTHLDALLADSTQSYTVFVPQTMGGIDAVKNANLDSLTNLVKYHILPGRVYGTNLVALYKGDGVANDTLAYQTLNGKKLKLIVPPPGNSFYFDNFYIQGLGDSQSQNFYATYAITAGIGIIQPINNPLTP